MPLDLALSTNIPTGTFELRQLQPLGDRGHLAAFLIVRSGAFAAALPFVFTRDALHTFTKELDALCRLKHGAATLSGREGGDTIRFEATANERLRITGELRDAGDDQFLRFAFHAEWHGMPPLTDGFHRAIDASATG